MAKTRYRVREPPTTALDEWLIRPARFDFFHELPVLGGRDAVATHWQAHRGRLERLFQERRGECRPVDLELCQQRPRGWWLFVWRGPELAEVRAGYLAAHPPWAATGDEIAWANEHFPGRIADA